MGRAAKRTALLLFVLGATLGLFLDWLHVVSGTTAYADTGLWGQPWWVPLLFGSASVGLGLGRVVVGRSLGEPRSVTRTEAGIALGVFVLAYAESAFLPDVAAIVALGITTAALGAWLDRSRAGLVAACGAAIAGPCTEIALTLAGAFRHVDPEPAIFGLVPVWLPLLYVCASVAVGALARSEIGGTRDATA